MGPGERLVYLNLESRAEWFQRTNLSNLSTTFFPSPQATCVPGLLPQTRARSSPASLSARQKLTLLTSTSGQMPQGGR